MPRPGAGTVQPVGFDSGAAFAHLRKADPVMARLLDANDIVLEEDDSRDGDHYAALIRAIVGQQLSTTVARVMWGRMLERFGGQPPAPEEVLADDPEELRAAIGLSRAKVSFLRSLAEHIVSGDLDLDHVVDAPRRRADR